MMTARSVTVDEPAAPHRSSRRILVVDDEPDLRETLAALLTARGHQVETAVDGRTGLEAMRRSAPDVVILDLMMPGMDGWQFRVEQKRDPHLADTPVVAYSASVASTAAAIDADCFLRKPVDVTRVEEAIEEVLATRERRRAPALRAQTERLVALGTLAAGVAHEINNPLTYVLINLERAQRKFDQLGAGPHFDEVKTMLAEVLEGVERIRSVTSSIRDFAQASRDDRGAPIDVRTVLESALRLLASDIAQHARLITEYGPPRLVQGNSARLGQVFLNLLMNALQALDPDRPAASQTIRVVTRVEGDRMVVEISDSGSGIEEHLLGHIFEPFFSTKGVGQGAGLGLSLSHGIVQAMGGEIGVVSQPGSGTTFRLAFPIVEPHSTRAVAAPPEGRSAARRRILLVDDERPLLLALSKALADRYDVVAACGGRQAIELLAEDAEFDAVLCDLHMPDVSGIEVLDEVARRAPALAAQVIFMTGGVFTDKARAFLQSTENRWLEKPLDLARLAQLLDGEPS